MKLRKVVIRVYGIWINDENQILLSDEYYNGAFFTKFPGGGLELGESVYECLKREWKEELAVEIEILRHFYTSEFFQQSAFDHSAQILSIYYLVRPTTEVKVSISMIKQEEQIIRQARQTFRWMKGAELRESHVTFPIDRKVATMLLETLL